MCELSSVYMHVFVCKCTYIIPVVSIYVYDNMFKQTRVKCFLHCYTNTLIRC